MTTSPPEAPQQPATPSEAPAKIDPRLRARRIQVQREAGRRRLRVAAVLAVVVTLAVGLGLLAVSPVLAVRDVEVSGAVYSDPAALDAIVGDVVGEPILTLDLGGIGERFETIPWVRRAEVRRHWPTGVHVELHERRPLAAFYASDGRMRVIDVEGHVIVALDGNPVDLVAITGVGPAVAPGEQAPAPYQGAARLVASLPDDLRARVAAVTVGDDGDLGLELVPTGRVLLGPATDLRAKVLGTIAVLAETPADAIDVVDLRVPDRPVLTTVPQEG
jgi:cell division protein FtsQ